MDTQSNILIHANSKHWSKPNRTGPVINAERWDDKSNGNYRQVNYKADGSVGRIDGSATEEGVFINRNVDYSTRSVQETETLYPRLHLMVGLKLIQVQRW